MIYTHIESFQSVSPLKGQSALHRDMRGNCETFKDVPREYLQVKMVIKPRVGNKYCTCRTSRSVLTRRQGKCCIKPAAVASIIPSVPCICMHSLKTLPQHATHLDEEGIDRRQISPMNLHRGTTSRPPSYRFLQQPPQPLVAAGGMLQGLVTSWLQARMPWYKGVTRYRACYNLVGL